MIEENAMNKTIKNVVWKLMERFLAQGVSFVVSVLLARLLLPDDYGTVTIVLIFTTLANVFMADGLATALIQKNDADDIDFSSVFFASLAIGVFIYLLLFIAAPFIENFYGESYKSLSLILRVLSIQIPIAAVQSVQQAYVARHMLFKLFFFSTLGGTIISGVVGIYMAYHGYGCWSLVFQYLTNTIIDTVILSFSTKWKPKMVFEFQRVKKMHSYSFNVMMASLVSTSYNELGSFVIGKKCGAADVSYYDKGRQFPNLILFNVAASIMSVLYPMLSNLNKNDEEFNRIYLNFTSITTYLMFPILLGLYVISEDLVIVLLTEKWINSVPFLKVFCIYGMVYTLHITPMQAIKAKGLSNIQLKIEVLEKVFGILMFIFMLSKGALWISITFVIAKAFMSICYIIAIQKYVGITIYQQIATIFPNLEIAVVMFLAVICFPSINCNRVLLIGIKILLGVLVYAAGSLVLKKTGLASVKEAFLQKREIE